MALIERDETKAEPFSDKYVEAVIGIEQLENLEYNVEKNAWFTHTHYKSQDETTKTFKRFCFRVIDYSPYSKENISFAFSNDKSGLDIVYDDNKDVWYQKAIVKKNRKEHKWIYDNSNSAIGICASGIFNVQAIVDGVVVYTSPNVIVLPSCITGHDYISMLNDLVRVNRKLIYREKSISLGQNKRTTFEKEKVAIEELYKYLIQINKKPETKLIRETQALQKNRIRKFDTKAIINLSTSNTPKIKTMVDCQTIDIYEHKVIYLLTERLKKYIEIKYNQMICDIENISENYFSDEPKSEFLAKEYVKQLSEENKERSKLKNEIENYKREIEIQCQEIHKTFQQIEKLELFSKITKENVSIQPTALFLFNPLYSKVWDIFKKIPEIKDHNYLTTFSLTQNINTVNVENTEQIYEYWCFVKLLDLLTELGWEIIDNGIEDVKACLREYIEQKTKSGSIKGDTSDKKMGQFSINLKKEIKTSRKKEEQNEEKKITVIFDKPISEENKKRPDFTIRCDNMDVFLDAKYMDKKHATDQLYPVAVEKYLITPNSEGRKTVASFIIHPNAEATYFGGREINRKKSQEIENNTKIKIDKCHNAHRYGYCAHRYGYIEFIPNKTDKMRHFLRMIFEYHFGFKYNCWNCGSNQVDILEDSTTKGGNEKSPCTCKNCKSFWVETNCGNPKGSHTIIKRQYGCYHKYARIDGNGFNVKCPVCGRELDPKYKKGDIIYEEIPFIS